LKKRSGNPICCKSLRFSDISRPPAIVAPAVMAVQAAPAAPAPSAKIPDMSSTGPDNTAVSIARDARQNMRPPAPAKSVGTFGGGGTTLQ